MDKSNSITIKPLDLSTKLPKTCLNAFKLNLFQERLEARNLKKIKLKRVQITTHY